MLRDDYTGKIEQVNAGLLNLLLDAGLTPVIAPLALSTQGDALNVDADRAAAMVAGAVQAEELIILTNVPGLMRSFPDESTLIAHLPKAGLEQALSFAEGRMKKKVLGASEALDLGVPKVIFCRRAHRPPPPGCPGRERNAHILILLRPGTVRKYLGA